MKKRVSIVMPVYNTGELLRKSVNSVLQSDYRNIELLIIDDGSAKETADLCDILGEKDERIKVIHQKNGGVSAARNNGLLHATGDYITFVDADDLLEENALSDLLDIAERENADVVVGGYCECFENGGQAEIGYNRKTEARTGQDILVEFFITNNIGWNVWGKLYKREAVQGVFFIEGRKIAEDMFFVYQTLKRINKLVICGIPVYRYIKNAESATADSNCLKFFDSFDLTRAVYQDPETEALYRNEKTVFYIQNAMFFFRFIYAKDKKGFARAESNKAKDVFLSDIQKCDTNVSLRIKLEVLMLRWMPELFKAYARYSWKRRESNNKKRPYKDLRERLQREKANYPISWFDNISSNQRVYNWKFVKLLRKCEYLRSKTKDSKNPMWKALYWICRAKKNRLGVFIGVDIPEGVFDEGLIIHHNGNIVVNGSSRVGKNCQLHGDNCIGNTGKANSLTDCPVIGDNVDIGVGAKLIGGIVIADNIKIGANAVVTRSFEEEGITLVGIPAHKLEKE